MRHDDGRQHGQLPDRTTRGTTGTADADVDVTVECAPPTPGCTHTIGYWKNHAGFGPQADVVTPLLPIRLGSAGGAKSIDVTTAAKAVSLLKMEGSNGVKAASNGINKLYAQLLGAKLSGADGADGSAIAGVIGAADAFLGHQRLAELERPHEGSAGHGQRVDDVARQLQQRAARSGALRLAATRSA